MSRKSLTFPYKDSEYTVAEILEMPECTITKNCLYWRISRLGMSVEDALSKPVVAVADKAEWFGQMKKPAEIAKDKRCLVDYRTLLARLKAGWPVMKAATFPKKEVPLAKQSIIITDEPVKTDAESERLKAIMSTPINQEPTAISQLAKSCWSERTNRSEEVRYENPCFRCSYKNRVVHRKSQKLNRQDRMRWWSLGLQN